jgi:hypothetical protein
MLDPVAPRSDRVLRRKASFFACHACWLRTIAAALRAGEEKLLKHCRMMEETFRDVSAAHQLAISLPNNSGFSRERVVGFRVSGQIVKLGK